MIARRHLSVVGASGVIVLAVVVVGLIVPQINHAAGRSLTAITVTPSNPTINAGQTESFAATGTFSDGSTQVLNTGGGTWAATGSLATPRFYHSATLLQDGSVLVVGGYNSAGVSQASAERFYPASGTWIPAGSMASARLAHTATLLPGGKVLIAGGIRYPDNTVFNTTELYDPNTNSWSAGPPLTLGPRSGHSAVLLATGKVLVAAGLQIYPSCTYLASAELYDAVANSWTATGSLSLGRSSATATILADGNVLLAGGPENNCPGANSGLSEAEVYSLATGTWSVAGSLSISRYANTITLLGNGKVLLGGGYTSGNAVTATADLFDPTTDTFALTGALPAPRVTISGTGDNGDTPLLQSGKVLVAGGLGSGGVILGSAALYDPASGTWAATSSLATPRAYSTTTLLQDGKVLVVGGLGVGNVTLTSAEVYDPQDFSWASTDGNVAAITQAGLATGLVNGTTTITATSGSIIGSTTLTVADTIAPTTSATLAPAANGSGWNNTNVTVTLNAADNAGGSGVQSISYTLSGAQSGGGTVAGNSTAPVVSAEGVTSVTYHATDNAGNIEVDQALTVKIDKTGPTLSDLPNITVNATSSAGAVVTFNPAASDALSGVATMTVTQGLPSGSTFPHGTTSEQVTATDAAGNSTIQSFNVTVNKVLVSIGVSPPTATVTASQPNQQFTATGTYTDASTQLLSGGTFAATGSLTTPRLYHTATLLQDGSVLVVGGYNNSITFASAERYYPATGTWVSAGSMTSARTGHTATLLPSGKVLVAGGIRYPQNNMYDTTEIYDPVANSWTAGPSLTLGVREAHSAVLLGNGKVLVAAGLQSYPDCTYRANAELYDPVTNSWTPTGSLHLARSSATTILLANGKVLLAGGPQNNCPTPNNGMNQAEIYDPVSGTWAVTGSLSLPRYANTISLLANGRVLLAGGSSAGALATADVYDPITGAFSLTGSLATARENFSPGTGDNGASPVLQNGRVLVAGGTNNGGTFLASAELYDPASGTWSTTAPMATARAFNTATLLQNGRVLVVGGLGAGSVALGSSEIYDPPTVFWESANTTVATVAQTGKATGISNGTTAITATSGGIIGSASLLVDRTAPTTTATPSAAANAAGWNKTIVNVMLHATDNAGGGVQSITYSLNGQQVGGATVPGDTTSVSLFMDGTTTIRYYATDINGNVESEHALSFKIDQTAPLLNFPFQVQTNATSSAGAVVTFSVAGSDSTSGLVGPATVSPLASGATFPVGTTTETVTATDVAGNVATATFNVIVNPFDSTPPTTNASFPAPNANGWHRFNVFISLNAFDSGDTASPSGVQSVTYSLSGAQTGGGTFNTCCPSFTISNEGTTTLIYHATDNNGNVEPDHTLTIKLDKTSPTAANLSNQTVQATSSAGAVVFFDPAAGDSLSGISGVSLTQGLPSGSTFPHGTTSESVTITDLAGNSISRFFSITVNKTLLSIVVSPATASMSVGDNRSYQATGHFTNGPDQTLPTSGAGGGGGGGGFGQAWQIQFPLTEALNVSACGGSTGGFTSQPFGASNGSSGQAMYGAVSQTWGSPAIVQVGGTVTAAEVHLTLSCIPSNGVTGTIDALWTGTRFEGTWELGGSSGHATILGWSTKVPLSAPRFSLGAAAVNGLVYAMGGGNPSQPSPVEAYNPATDSWSTASQMPVSSEGPGVAALGGIIYVAGGHVAGGNASGVFQGYNAATGSWLSGLPAMPTARAYPALVAAGGKLYAIGGSTGAGSATPTAVVERYDPVANVWATLASMSRPRAFHVAGALNSDSTIVAAGGNTSSTELYNVATNTWTAGPAMVSTLGSPAAAVVNNALFVVGVGGAQMFRPAGTLPSGWAGVAPMPTSRGQLGVAAVGDVIYAIGGMLPGGEAAIATVEAFSTPLPSNFSVSSGGGGGGGNSTPVVSWQSTNPSVAGINSSAFATGNAVGQTTIVATAGGVSCATTNTCGTLTVTEPGHLTLTLAPASAVFATVAVEIIDPSTGTAVEGPFNVPIGQTQSIDNESAFRLRFTAPAGYTVAPVTVDLTVHSGDNITVPLFFAVIDTTPPMIDAHANVTAEATGANGAVVSYSSPASHNAVSGDGIATCAPASGSTFALGTTTVACSAVDGAGNMGHSSFTVTVQDTVAPTLTLPAGITVDATSPSGAFVVYATSATDIVSGPVTVTCVLPSGSTFAIGTSTVNCTSTDGAGNPAIGSFQVLVQAAAAQVGNLIVTVQNFNLAQGISNSLDAKLQNILSALSAAQGGSVTNTCNQLAAFINQTTAQSGQRLTAAQAAQLIAAATQIQAVIGCQ